MISPYLRKEISIFKHNILPRSASILCSFATPLYQAPSIIGRKKGNRIRCLRPHFLEFLNDSITTARFLIQHYRFIANLFHKRLHFTKHLSVSTMNYKYAFVFHHASLINSLYDPRELWWIFNFPLQSICYRRALFIKEFLLLPI